MNIRRHHVMEIRKDRCLRTWDLRRLPDVLTPAQLRWKWSWWGKLKEKSQAKELCSPTAIIRHVFPDATEDAALRVAYCESHLYTYAHNASGASGLFQLMPFWWAGKFDPYDPVANTKAAYSISDAGYDWSAWICQP